MAVEAGRTYDWDHRFYVSFNLAKTNKNQNVRLQPLGAAGWSEVVAEKPGVRALKMPEPVRLTLPVLADERGVFSAPHLNFHRYGDKQPSMGFEKVVFRPRQTLSGTGFIVAE